MRHRRVAALSLLFVLGLFAPRALGEDGMFDAKGVKIHYIVEGAGPPVVLIHGLNSSARANWQAPGILAALAKHHRVIAFDLPGHGMSDAPDDENAYGVQMAQDVALLMDELKVPKAQIVGYSLGGMIAMKFLALHPDRVTAATIGGMGWLRDGSALQRSWERLPGQAGSRTPVVCVHAAAKLALTREELTGIHVPVEILIGDRDPVRKLYVIPLQEVRKDWPVIEIRDAGHITCVVKKQFAEELVAWVTKNDPGAATAPH